MDPINNETASYRMMAVDQLPETPVLLTIYYVRGEDRGYLWDPQQGKYLPIFGPDNPEIPLMAEVEGPDQWFVPPTWICTGEGPELPPSTP